MTRKRGRFSRDEIRKLGESAPDRLMPPGSFVRLRSGGPIGVVVELWDSDHVGIVWLTGLRQRSVLPDVCVEPSIGEFSRRDAK